MTDEELQRVENFEVRHKKHGRIVFQGTTDLRGLDLDQLIVFGNRTVDVYPDESVKPPMGQGLNKPARITLCDIFPGKNASAEQVADKLRRFTAKQDAEFLSYSAPEGEWSFRVEHFSRYGLLDEEDEEEQGEQQEAEELPGGALFQVRPPGRGGRGGAGRTARGGGASGWSTFPGTASWTRRTRRSRENSKR